MKMVMRWLSGILLSTTPGIAFCQERAAEPDWMGELVAFYRDSATPLEQVDPRNHKLFADPGFLDAIDQKECFVREVEHEWAVRSALNLLARQFSALKDLPSSVSVESAVNLFSHDVFLRGKSGKFYFAAAIPIGDASGGEPRGPLALTIAVRPDDAQEDIFSRDAHLRLAGRNDQAMELTRLLSAVGKIQVKNVTDAAANGDVTRIQGDAVYEGIGVSGKLRVSVAPRALYLELAEPTLIDAKKWLSGKAFIIEYRSCPERQPDWEGAGRVYEHRTETPEPNGQESKRAEEE